MQFHYSPLSGTVAFLFAAPQPIPNNSWPSPTGPAAYTFSFFFDFQKQIEVHFHIDPYWCASPNYPIVKNLPSICLSMVILALPQQSPAALFLGEWGQQKPLSPPPSLWLCVTALALLWRAHSVLLAVCPCPFSAGSSHLLPLVQIKHTAPVAAGTGCSMPGLSSVLLWVASLNKPSLSVNMRHLTK